MRLIDQPSKGVNIMSCIHRFIKGENKFGWDGVSPELLTDPGIKGATKHVLIGGNENAPHFIMRYFQLIPQGHSKLERHPQEHEILVLEGKGQVQIGNDLHDLSPMDVVYIQPNELHQFTNTGNEPFGFICIIPK
jgi:quercetin dioxygenase-like cupin family protein